MFLPEYLRNKITDLGKENTQKKSVKTLGISKILEYMPQRPPFLMLDKVTNYEEGKYLTAVKMLCVNEPYIRCEENKEIAMPDVLILETIAQASGLLAVISQDSFSRKNGMFYLAGIKNPVFCNSAQPGDQLTIDIQLNYVRNKIWCFSGVVAKENSIVAKADVVGAQVSNTSPCHVVE